MTDESQTKPKGTILNCLENFPTWAYEIELVLINKSYVDSSLVTHPLWLEERKDEDGKILPAGPADHPKAMAEIFGRLNDSDRNRALSFRNKGGATAFFRSML